MDTTKYDSNVFLLGQVAINKVSHQVIYFTVIPVADAPATITKFIANELFATKGGETLNIYVLEPVDQEITAPENFTYDKYLIRPGKFATDHKNSFNGFFLLQFMAFEKLCTDVLSLSAGDAGIWGYLNGLCETHRLINKIKTIVLETVDVNKIQA